MMEMITGPIATERDVDVKRKRRARSEAARIEIPPCKNPRRRERCLVDPERFLRTYFADRYPLPFGKDHRFIIESIVNVATRGGKQAVAAPRGRGKSEIVKGMLAYLVLAEMSRFVMAMAATTPLASRLFNDFKRKIKLNTLLLEDFPEVCVPVRELDGAPQRAAKQHVDGQLTEIVWTGDYISLPRVEGSPYGGVKMAYSGLDAAFRGMNIDGDRPDLVIVDDPETQESASSEMQVADRGEMLDRDIAGLVGQNSRLGVFIVTTVQNHYCLSAQLTDPARKPAYNGRRYGLVVRWPDNMEMWNEYISIRKANQQAGDACGMGAVEFYLANRQAMDAGAEMIDSHYVPIDGPDGRATVYSALQSAFNKIADTNMDAFKTEYQNDPDPGDIIDSVGLTAGIVASRISGLMQGELPNDTRHITIGCDIGKYYSHWVKVAWHGNAIGNIVDYGVIETPMMTAATNDKAVSAALLPALMQWRFDMLAGSGIDFCLVDSGDYTEAVYEFIRSAGGMPFAAAKGWDRGRFNVGKDGPDRRVFLEAFASHQRTEGLWLYNVNTEFWKQWVQERFITKTFDDNQQWNDGTLSLYAAPGDRKRHLSFSHHMVSEERTEQFVHGKGLVRKWVVKNRNNHYLDAIALACAAAGCLGVRIVPRESTQQVTRPAAKIVAPLVNPHGQPYLVTERK